MEKQATFDLFTNFLRKRQIKHIDLHKDLPDLLDHACNQGCFQNPHLVHELREWEKLGNKIRDALLEDDKVAKKMGKLWRVVHNELQQYQAERKAIQQANVVHERSQEPAVSGYECPLPPAASTAGPRPPAAACACEPPLAAVPPWASRFAPIKAGSASAITIAFIRGAEQEAAHRKSRDGGSRKTRVQEVSGYQRSPREEQPRGRVGLRCLLLPSRVLLLGSADPAGAFANAHFVELGGGRGGAAWLSPPGAPLRLGLRRLARAQARVPGRLAPALPLGQGRRRKTHVPPLPPGPGPGPASGFSCCCSIRNEKSQRIAQLNPPTADENRLVGSDLAQRGAVRLCPLIRAETFVKQ